MNMKNVTFMRNGKKLLGRGNMFSLFLVLLCMNPSWSRGEEKRLSPTISIEEKDGKLYFDNNKIQMEFNLRNGLFSLYKAGGEKVVDNAWFQCNGVQSKDSCRKISWREEHCSDALGTGKTATLTVEIDNYPDIIWQVTLYNDREFAVFNMGIDNDTDRPCRLMCFYPLMSHQVYMGKNVRENYRVLDGNGGGVPTRVSDARSLTSFNNMLARFGSAQQPEIVVAGGLSYNEFEKFVRFVADRNSMQIYMYAEDPVGRLIDPQQKYMLDERFYFCFINDNPFEALEKYGEALKKTQQIELNYYDFPTECLWYASLYNLDAGREKFNNSKGAVEEMDNAVKSGITRYTKAAIRLVPDAYTPNNQQGWWDDEHWGMYNESASTMLPHYTEPYTTTESWAQAIIALGGYPFTYMQSGRRSEDFVKLHPDWMLFNDPYRPVIGNRRLTQEVSYLSEFSESHSKHWWSDRMVWGYDFTDPGFIKHMQQVYAHMKRAGIKGVFYDYPEVTAWAFEGGFEDRYATTARAYRRMFELAVEGLGKDAFLQERNITRGSDITLGLTSSQRVWGDTDLISPEMISYGGFRWYKNRVAINYDMDSKALTKALPANRDGVRAMLTMSYVTSGRFLLGNSFSQLSVEQLYDMSRTFPYHATPRSARPIDAFDHGVKFPRMYDFEVNPSWHLLTLYNHNTDTAKTEGSDFVVHPGKSLNEGGLGLDAAKQYYAWDFWNNCSAGLIDGSQAFRQTLRTGEARMIALHAKEDRPQFISTSRHIMQGYIDLKDVAWDEKTKTLSGVASVVEGDTFIIIVAANGYTARSIKVSSGGAFLKEADAKHGLLSLSLYSKKSKEIRWRLSFR
jgi:hypothetical protein